MTAPFYTTFYCVLVNANAKVLHRPFQLAVPLSADCNKIFAFLKLSVPILRGMDNELFSFHEPLALIPSRVSVNTLTREQVNLEAAGVERWQSPTIALERDRKRTSGVEAIICISTPVGGHPLDSVQVLSALAGVGLSSLVTIALPKGVDIRRVGPSHLGTNGVEIVKSGSVVPSFVSELNATLLAKRHLNPAIMPDHYYQFLRESLNNDYDTYFTDQPNPDDILGVVAPLECFHYNDVLFDETLRDSRAYGKNKESHIFSLLRRLMAVAGDGQTVTFNKPWEISLIISRQDSLTSYVPRSDFHVALRNFPNLLLEVNSDSNQGDENRMLVQGACLVRLGNALKVGGPSNFVVKAVYINDSFEATEYTLFQRQRQVAEILEQHRIKVDFVKTATYYLHNELDAFKFIFRLYNLLHWSGMADFNFSEDAYGLLSELKNQITSLSSRSKSRGQTMQTTPASQDTGHAPAGGPVQTLSQIAQKEGYTLLASLQNNNRLAKAFKNGRVVALKILPGAGGPSRQGNDELGILSGLQKFDSPRNHTIKLLKIFYHSDTPFNVIVMPWHLSLDEFLGGFPTMTDLIWRQFLEGVSFLHEHGVAHLDLKPLNVLVGHVDESSPQPRLSIIDFGISVRVENEKTMVQGYRGTLSWTAPEVGAEYGPPKTYSPILADRWSCGRVLQHIRKFRPTNDASMFRSVQDQLLSQVPSDRPPLGQVLDGLECIHVTRSEKRGGKGGTLVMQKRRKGSFRATRSHIMSKVREGTQ